MADQPESMVVEAPLDQPTEIVLPSDVKAKELSLEPVVDEKPAIEEVLSYQPNFKYKVYDKELEMPEWARPFVTSKELEENFRGLYCKADALDQYKEKHEGLKGKHEQISTEYNQTLDRLAELQTYMDNDLHTFFEEVKIPQEKIIQYVKHRLMLNDMSPEQREMEERSRKNLRQSFQSNQQVSMLQEQNYKLMKNQHELEYERSFEIPEISEFKRAFEERLGAGAFRKHADDYGNLKYAETGRNISPLEAIQYVMNQYGKLFPKESDTPTDLIEAKKDRESRKPAGSIPNVGRGQQSVSPTKPRFKDLDALKTHIKSQIVG